MFVKWKYYNNILKTFKSGVHVPCMEFMISIQVPGQQDGYGHLIRLTFSIWIETKLLIDHGWLMSTPIAWM